MLEVPTVYLLFRATVCAVCVACSGFGQQKLTLQEAVQEAISRHPSLAAADSRITAYMVESENFESIHNHSAYAMIAKGMDAR